MLSDIFLPMLVKKSQKPSAIFFCPASPDLKNVGISSDTGLEPYRHLVIFHFSETELALLILSSKNSFLAFRMSE